MTETLVQVPCNLCGSSESEFLYEKQGLNTVRCKTCGLVYVNPRLSPESIRALYEEEFFTQNDAGVGCNCFEDDSLRYDLLRFKADLKAIERLRPQKGKLLDVGCGLGRFVGHARENGWEAEGMDFSSYAVAYGIKQELPIKCGTLTDYPRGAFDVVTMFHLLEHLENPLGFLSEEVAPLLKPDGLCVIEIPNFGCKDSRELKSEWIWARPREHLYGFTVDTLKKMTAKAGFDLIEIMEKSVLTFGGRIQDPGQIETYRKLSESAFGEKIKQKIRETPLWTLVRKARGAAVSFTQALKKVEKGDMEIFCVVRKDSHG